MLPGMLGGSSPVTRGSRLQMSSTRLPLEMPCRRCYTQQNAAGEMFDACGLLSATFQTHC
jgi:hypothetical protein